MKFLSALIISVSVASGLNAGDEAGSVIDLMGSSCKHGPANQPSGEFLAFVFCDNALGTNLGIVLSSLTNEIDGTTGWRIDQRFWQDGPWVTDVTSIAWDPFSDRLYVATSEVYGDGGIFVLDLIQRKHERIYSIGDVNSQAVRETAKELQAESHFGYIEALNVKNRSITVSIRLAYGEGESKIVGKKTFSLGSGT